MLDWESAQFRDNIAAALGQISDESAIKLLIRRLNDDNSTIRKIAARALSQIGDKQSVPALIQFLERLQSSCEEESSWEEDLRRVILEFFVRVEDKDVDEYLVKRLEDNYKNRISILNITEILCCVELIGEGTKAKAVECLTKVLFDITFPRHLYLEKNRWVPKTLAKLSAYQPLIAVLKDLESPWREEVHRALRESEWKPSNQVEAIMYFIAGEAWDELVKIGEPAVEPLIHFLQFGRKKKNTIQTLGKIRDKRAINPLIKALYDEYASEDASLRYHIILALAEIGGEAVIKPLTQKLKDQSGGVRRTAADSLDKIGWHPLNDEETIDYLIAKCAWDELVKIGDKAVQALAHALTHATSYYNPITGICQGAKELGEIVETLGRIGSTKTIEALIQALGNENVVGRGHIPPDWDIHYYVYERAMDELERLGQNASEPLTRSLQDFIEKGDITSDIRPRIEEVLSRIS